MSVRKNAKALTAAERDAFVRACVMMKADIVNPTAAPADRYSRWDENVALHHFIQNANTPGASNVNFGHGGTGAYGFLPWHRYFLYRLEQQLQSYVPGVMLPYWDWTDPAGTIMVADFLGPDGNPTSSYELRQGYFAREAPGTGANTTPSPVWWPASLSGWTLHATFGTMAGALRRRIGAAVALPSVASLRSCLSKTDYPSFQVALEGGIGVTPPHSLHNALHGWFGSVSHMWSTTVSAFDPMFYLHHCNIDRLWAMWQMDGHATEYPTSGGNAEHHRTDPMYPWVGTLAGYSTNNTHPPIVLPDLAALGVITAADVLDHRALGYSYDTQVVIGIALDRTGSMAGLTPDPMTTGAPDVTKWEAARRGVAAFLQDCEASYQSAQAYVVAGVETFRSLPANEFAPVFAGTPYGLIQAGGAYNRAAFEAVVAGQTPGGGTPLADALLDTHATLVQPPLGGHAANERRYLALFTDGILTAGAPLASIPDASLADTAVFAMGFGTAADVDYATLAGLVAKGETLSTPQVFHGENAGVIDKFFSNALAASLGFVPVMDPVLELFAGEHVHFEFTATSAEDAFFVTAQGMDFVDDAWAFQLIGPDGAVVYADGGLSDHVHGGHPGGRTANASARRGAGRLSLFVQRDSADAMAWVGTWTLMVAWRARELDAMVMLDRGELLVPVAAGPVRGPRHARLLMKPEKRPVARAVVAEQRHRLDIRPTSTNLSDRRACSVVVNVYAKTRLAVTLETDGKAAGLPLAVRIDTATMRGAATGVRAVSRLVAPTRDLAALLHSRKAAATATRAMRLDRSDGVPFDAARVLARLERADPRLAMLRDEEVAVVSHHGGAPHLHVEKTDVPGPYHVGVWLEGTYLPTRSGAHDHSGHSGHGPETGDAEYFTRLLSLSVGLPARREPRAAGRRRARRSGRQKRAKRPRN